MYTFHGKTLTPEYVAWRAMKRRCYRSKCKAYKNYGGRGIIVCARWLESFENFLADMGKRPTKKHTLDRRNNDGNYEPKNCRWATRKQQNDNRRGVNPDSICLCGKKAVARGLCKRHYMAEKYKQIKQGIWNPRKFSRR